MTASFGPIIRSFSPSSIAPSRPVRCAACCATRSALYGSMRSAGARRESSAEPLVLDALGIGDLVHMVLDRALRELEAAGGLATADAEQIAAAVDRGRASRRRRLGRRAAGAAGRHLAADAGRGPR